MTVDTWFPLAIYHEDLAGSDLRKAALLERIALLRNASGPQATDPGASWTGDVHGVDQIHHDPGFDWITRAVASHSVAYLRALGHDLGRLALHVQRAWPVVTGRGQAVFRHAHHTAHLSAVYYVAVPGGAASGRIRFHNQAAQNVVAPGLGSGRTAAYGESNPLNAGFTDYDPVEGRLLLFPARTPHSVAANETDTLRISLAFDLVLTAREEAPTGTDEFLMPAPARWRRVHPAIAPAQAAPTPPPDRIDLVAFGGGAAFDRLTLVTPDDHPLWRPAVLADVSGPAAWRAYAAELAGADWQAQDGLAQDGLARADMGARWRAFRDGAARLVSHLRRAGVALDRASLGQPEVWRLDAPQPRAIRRRSGHATIYLRLDAPGPGAWIDLDGGESLTLPPGAMAVMPGCRGHRLRGACTLLVFGLDLPGVARPGLSDDALPEDVAFHRLTALPLATPPPPPGLIAARRGWLQAHALRRTRADGDPAVRRFLIEGADPACADSAEIEAVRACGRPGAMPGRLALVPALDPETCAALCRFAADHLTAGAPDSVDDVPQYQLDLTLDMLTTLVGAAATRRLLSLPGLPDGHAPSSIFLRAYCPEGRPFIPFHVDLARTTANVALNAPADYEGGALVVLEGDRLRAVPRRIGEATVHAGNLVHGVARVTRGRRLSLVIFFDPAPEAASAPGS